LFLNDDNRIGAPQKYIERKAVYVRYRTDCFLRSQFEAESQCATRRPARIRSAIRHRSSDSRIGPQLDGGVQ